MRIGQSLLRPWMFVSAAWFGAAGLAVISEALQRGLNGESWRFHDLLFAGGGGWLVCAFLTPAIFRVSKRWPFSGPDQWRRVALHVALSLIFWIVGGVVYQGVLALLINPHAIEGATTGAELFRQLSTRAMSWTFNTLPFGAAVYGSGVGIEHAIRYFVEARASEVQVARLSEQLSGARFVALQTQVNPHFLFNTLNTIAVLVRDNDRHGAVRIVEQLSEVLRSTLNNHRANEVTLGEELELVRQYVAIEQARFSDRLRSEFRIVGSLLPLAMPSFALQHLVENAIRHGIARRPDAGRLFVAARRDGDLLEVSVTDDGVGIDANVVIPKGHGIDNTRERLRVLYGVCSSLGIVRRPEGGTIATLRVPCREMVPEQNRETR